MYTPCLISGGSRWQGTKLVGGKRRTQSWPTSDPEAFTKADSFCQGSDVRVDDLFGPQPGATAAGGSNRLAAEAGVDESRGAAAGGSKRLAAEAGVDVGPGAAAGGSKRLAAEAGVDVGPGAAAGGSKGCSAKAAVPDSYPDSHPIQTRNRPRRAPARQRAQRQLN